MQEMPKFIKDFSKEESQKSRDATARKIREARMRRDELKEKMEGSHQLKESLDALNDEIDRARQEPQDILRRFYADQQEKWAEAPYTLEDAKAHFTEENLASLSLEAYGLLMRRFPNEMVTHVTRQGIRDHTGHGWHTAGRGEHHDNFEQLLRDGRLRSAFSMCVKEEKKRKEVGSFIHLDEASSREEAMQELETFLNPEAMLQGSIADRTAIHLAAEEVADSYYGAEHGNEIFVAYPSVLIASQHAFTGKLNEAGGGYHNDQWVWADDERGLGLDSGVVFIPKDARVSQKTGSRYELDENKQPKMNDEMIQRVLAFANSPDFADYLQRLDKTDNDIPRGSSREERAAAFAALRQELIEKWGLTETRLQDVLLNRFYTSNYLRMSQENEVENILKILEPAGLKYIEAQDAISSEEYWEKYFNAHPEQRPARTFYYAGGDPTEGLREFKKKFQLTKRAEDSAIPMRGTAGKLTTDNPAYLGESHRFIDLAVNIIDERFPAEDIPESL